MTGLVLWALLQSLTVLGVLNYARHLPVDRQIEAPAGAVVIMSVRDDWDGGAELLVRLRRQSAPFRLVIATSGNCPRARALAAEEPDWIEVVTAGVAIDEGQKIHKIRAALAALRAADRYLVFIDVDILPPDRFIGRLLFPLVRGKSDLATGYRMLLPDRLVLGAIGAVEMQVATMPRLTSGTMPWGGAMAMTREAAERMDLQGGLAGRLTDDIPTGLLARGAGLRLRAVRDLLVATPFDGGWGAAFDFAVRQYRHVLTNCSGLWGRAFGIVLLQAAAWALVLAMGGFGGFAIGYGAAWARVAVRYRILRSVLEPAQMAGVRRSLLWDAALPFAVVWLHLVVQIVSATSTRIRWGGFDYWMRGGRVARMARVVKRGG